MYHKRVDGSLGQYCAILRPLSSQSYNCRKTDVHGHVEIWGQWSTAPHILSFSTRWRQVVTLRAFLLYPHHPPKKDGGWDSAASLDRRLGVPQDWSGWCGEHNFCPCWEL